MAETAKKAPAKKAAPKKKTPEQLLKALQKAVADARKEGYVIKGLATWNDENDGGTTTRF